MSSCPLLLLQPYVWLRTALFLSWQERLLQACHLCRRLVSAVRDCGDFDHLRLTVAVLHALCSFNRSAIRMLSDAPSVSIDAALAAGILRDSDEPLRTLLTSLSQLPGFSPPLHSVRSLYAGGEVVQCALDSRLPLSQLSSLALQPVTARSRLMRVRNRLWCALHCLPRLRRLKLDDYELNAADDSVLLSLPLEHLDLSSCTRLDSAEDSMAAVGVSHTLRSLVLETTCTRMSEQAVSALLFNLQRSPRLRYLTLSADLSPSRLRLLSSIRQLTSVDLSASAIVATYLSFFTSATGDPMLPCLLHFCSAHARLVSHTPGEHAEASLDSAVVRFARAYNQLHTCKLAVSSGVGNTAATQALLELPQVRVFGLVGARTERSSTRDEQPDSDEDDEAAQDEATEERKVAAVERPSVVRQPLCLVWLSQLELDGVPVQDASLLAVLQGCQRLRRVTCRNCNWQTTAAWLLAATSAPYLLSLILYAEEVKVTAAAWKKAAEAFPSLAYLLDCHGGAELPPPALRQSGYPELAQVEIRLLSEQQSDKAGFASLMHLMAHAPLTALNIHLPANAVFSSRIQQLKAMSHMTSLHIVPTHTHAQAATAEGRRHREAADSVQRLLGTCVHERQLNQQQSAERTVGGWQRELLGDAQEAEKEGSLSNHRAAADDLVQGDDYNQADGMFSQRFDAAGDNAGRRVGRERFFHELAGLCGAEGA